MNNLAILALDDFEHWSNQKSLSMGGATGVIKSILPYLKADKIYLLGITSNKNNLYKEITFDKNIIIVPIVLVPKGSKVPVRIFAFYFSRKINAILAKYNIRSVYSHAEEMGYWIKPGPTVLYHMHGSANALVKAKNKLFRFKLLQYMWETVRKKNIENATRIIAIDPLCLNLTKKLKQEGKTILLPNFVDTRIFYKDDTSCQLLEHIQEKILLFIGRIEEVKGLELFVDTLLNINKKEPGDWKGVFIGRGTYEPVVKKYIAALSATDLFFFAGPVFEQADLRKVYNRASLLMISSHFEGIPMVILESMACGTPVISTDVGGIKELIADNKMCYVNGRRDPAEFAELAISILKGEEAMMDEIKYSSSGASEIINEIFINKS